MLYTLIQAPRKKEEVIFVDVAKDKGYSFSGQIDTSSRENPLIELDIIIYNNIKDTQEAYRCVLKQEPFPIDSGAVVKEKIQQFVKTEIQSFITEGSKSAKTITAQHANDLSQEATQFATAISEVIYRDILEYLRKSHN